MDRVASRAGPIASMFGTMMTPATSAPTSQIGTTETGTTWRAGHLRGAHDRWSGLRILFPKGVVDANGDAKDSGGYWVASADRSVFTYGDAAYNGRVGSGPLRPDYRCRPTAGGSDDAGEF